MLKHYSGNNPILAVVLFFLMAGCAMAGPIEFSEVRLMLKHGISSAELAKEIKAHKLAAPPTDAELAEMKGLGASGELLATLVDPANLLGKKESQAFLQEKEISAEEHLWVVGSVLNVKDGVMLVSCPDLHLKAGSLSQYLGVIRIEGPMPSMFKQNEAQEVWFVNCEVRKTGVCQMKNPSNEIQEVPVAELVRDFGKPQPPAQSPAPAAAPVTPARHEMTMQEGTWYHMSDPKSVPGGGPDAWICLVGSDQFQVMLQISEKGPNPSAPKSKFEIKKGTDAGGQNLTLVCMDEAWKVYWKDSIAFPGTGVFVFEHK